MNAHLGDVFEAIRAHAEVSHLHEFFSVLIGHKSPGLWRIEASGPFLRDEFRLALFYMICIRNVPANQAPPL